VVEAHREKVERYAIRRDDLSVAARPAKRHTLWRAIRDSWQAYALLLPVFSLLIVFNYYPPVLGLLRAFYRWRPGVPADFVGLQNFRTYLIAPETSREFMNMFKLMLFHLFAGVAVPFVMAELIYNIRSEAAKETYRLLVIIPLLAPGIVVTLLWKNIYDPRLGPINTLIRSLGLTGLDHNWLGEPQIALYAVMFLGFPWVSGVGTLIYLSGLAQISESVFDACSLDGCTGVRRMFQIDLPLVLGQVRLQTILSIIAGITSFQNILVLTGGGPGFSTYVPGLQMFYKAFRTQQFGYAAAIGLLLFALCMAATVIVNSSIRAHTEA